LYRLQKRAPLRDATTSSSPGAPMQLIALFNGRVALPIARRAAIQKTSEFGDFCGTPVDDNSSLRLQAFLTFNFLLLLLV
jgi:hypothetical protein